MTIIDITHMLWMSGWMPSDPGRKALRLFLEAWDAWTSCEAGWERGQRKT